MLSSAVQTATLHCCSSLHGSLLQVSPQLLVTQAWACGLSVQLSKTLSETNQGSRIESRGVETKKDGAVVKTTMTLIFTALAKQALSEDSLLLCIRLGVAHIVP